jgi:uncharacterized protein YgiM (DUF1202 family)
MRMGTTVRKRTLALILVGMTLLVAACTPSIAPAPTPTAPPPTEAPTVATVTPEQPTPTAVPPTPAPVVEEPSASVECNVAARGLRLRGGPGTDFDIIQSLSAGQPLIASARNADSTWAAVSTPDGQEGWVSVEFITCAQAVETLPLPPLEP